MRNTLFILLFLMVSTVANATEQTPDRLYYEGKNLTMNTSWTYPSPVQTYYSQNKMKYPFGFWSTANYRGHIATWEVVNEKLYIKEIRVREETFLPEKYDIKSKDETTNLGKSVFADWFCGMITCQDDVNSYYFYIKYGEAKNIRIYSKKDFKKLSKLSEKDTSNHELMDKYFMLVLGMNYNSFYFNLGVDDEISVDGRQGRFTNNVSFSNPLLEYYSNNPIEYPYNWENLKKNGAPNCRWSIDNDKIYLEKIHLYSGNGWNEFKKDSVDLNSIFNDTIANDKVFADWLNGIYFIKYGIEEESGLPIFPAFKNFTPTENGYLRVKDGVIQESYTVPSDSFKFGKIPDDTPLGLKQILEEIK